MQPGRHGALSGLVAGGDAGRVRERASLQRSCAARGWQADRGGEGQSGRHEHDQRRAAVDRVCARNVCGARCGGGSRCVVPNRRSVFTGSYPSASGDCITRNQGAGCGGAGGGEDTSRES